jgi:hypothetical protein
MQRLLSAVLRNIRKAFNGALQSGAGALLLSRTDRISAVRATHLGDHEEAIGATEKAQEGPAMYKRLFPLLTREFSQVETCTSRPSRNQSWPKCCGSFVQWYSRSG